MQVDLFITCYNDTLFPDTGRAAVRVLERLGHGVRFRVEQTCCGQMHYNTGYQAEAMPMCRRFVDLYQDAEAVVVPSTSCVSMMRDHYPKMTGGDGQLARDVADLLPRVFEFSEFLTRKLGVTDVGAFYPHRVTYHASCHGLRNLCLGDGPVSLLRGVRGAGVGPAGGAGPVLRVRRDVRGQERRREHRHAGQQVPGRARHPSRGGDGV